MPSYRLADLAERLQARLIGDGDRLIDGLGSLGDAQAGELSHLSSTAYRHLLPATKAGAVILKEADAADCPVDALVADNPYLTFAHASQLFAQPERLPAGLHPSAVVGEGVTIDGSAAIGPHVVIGDGCTIGPGARVHGHVSIGARCEIGEGVELHPNVTLYSDVRLGARTVVHSGAVLGADGFGFTPDGEGRLHAIAQLGGLTVGADVSIGANTTIDRGAIDDTVIEEGVKIDNLVQIGHNCRIGAHTIICGCVGIVGSTRIGRHCILAGGSGVGGDKPIELCDGVVVSVVTTITQSIDKPGVYSGSMLHNSHTTWKRNAIQLQSLDRLAKRVKKLERQLEKWQEAEEK